MSKDKSIVSREEIVSKLNQLQDIKNFFSEYFDTTIYDGFDDLTGVYSWYLNDDEIRWTYDKNEDIDLDDEDYEYEYGGEIYGTSIWIKEDFTLVRYDNGSGEYIYAVFDNKQRNLDW